MKFEQINSFHINNLTNVASIQFEALLFDIS